LIKVIRYTENPLSLIGEVASFCWNSTPSKEIAKKCLKADHGRVMEYADVTISIEGYSARVMREVFRHVIGATPLQESTRYVNCNAFTFYMPESIYKHPLSDAEKIYIDCMNTIKESYHLLLEQGIPKEDIANILPLGMHTKVSYKINLRAILHMFEVRTCTRAYKEFRDFMEEFRQILMNLDDDWKYIIGNYALTKCEKYNMCNEIKPCNKYLKGK